LFWANNEHIAIKTATIQAFAPNFSSLSGFLFAQLASLIHPTMK